MSTKEAICWQTGNGNRRWHHHVKEPPRLGPLPAQGAALLRRGIEGVHRLHHQAAGVGRGRPQERLGVVGRCRWL